MELIKGSYPMSGSCSSVLILLSVLSVLLSWSSCTQAASIHRRFQQRDHGGYQWAPNSQAGQLMMGNGGKQLQLEPPPRPASFANMDELNQYLEQLKKYYALLGRPRFGRGVYIPEEMDGLDLQGS